MTPGEPLPTNIFAPPGFLQPPTLCSSATPLKVNLFLPTRSLFSIFPQLRSISPVTCLLCSTPGSPTFSQLPRHSIVLVVIPFSYVSLSETLQDRHLFSDQWGFWFVLAGGGGGGGGVGVLGWCGGFFFGGLGFWWGGGGWWGGGIVYYPFLGAFVFFFYICKNFQCLLVFFLPINPPLAPGSSALPMFSFFPSPLSFPMWKASPPHPYYVSTPFLIFYSVLPPFHVQLPPFTDRFSASLFSSTLVFHFLVLLTITSFFFFV